MTMDTKGQSITEGSPINISPAMQRAAAYSWRILVISALVTLVAVVLYHLRVVTVPVFIALLFTTFLLPPVQFLKRHRFGPALATGTAFLGVIGILVALGFVLASPLSDEFADLGPQLETAVDDVNSWLVTGPLGLDQSQLDRYVDTIGAQLSENADTIRTGVITSATLAAEVFTGIILSIVLTFFFVKDGQELVRGIVNRFPEQHQALMSAAGARAFHTLGGYLRGVGATGLVDATFIGIALFVLDVPLLFPLVVLTFVGAFFPVVGATIAGVVAAAVALVNGGVSDMAIVIAVVLVVQQVEAHLLQPLLVGRAVNLHPVVILLSLGTGAVVAGLLGAFLAVPFVAVLGSVIREIDLHKAHQTLAKEVSPAS